MVCDNPKISENLPTFLDRGEKVFDTITVRKNQCQKYVFVSGESPSCERVFIVEEGAVLRASALVFGANRVLKMSVHVTGSNSEASLQLLGLATDQSQIEIDGIGRVDVGTHDVKLRVDQTNILLGEGARVRGRPVLEVATDSIEGGHSCKIHQISGDALFYVQSHGIDIIDAKQMLLDGEIMKHLEALENGAGEMKEEVRLKLQELSKGE